MLSFTVLKNIVKNTEGFVEIPATHGLKTEPEYMDFVFSYATNLSVP